MLGPVVWAAFPKVSGSSAKQRIAMTKPLSKNKDLKGISNFFMMNT